MIKKLQLLIAVAMVSLSFNAFAAVDQFLKLDGIDGESQDEVHTDEIDVLAWSWGLSQSGTTHMGAGGGAGKVNVQDISFTKFVDKSSTFLMMHVATGMRIYEATLTVRKAGGNQLEYIIIKMNDVMVTAVDTGGSGGEDKLTENIVLNFAKVTVTYVPQKADGSGGAEKEFCWDIVANVKC